MNLFLVWKRATLGLATNFFSPAILWLGSMHGRYITG